MTSNPCATRRAAATAESTPPLIATTTRWDIGRSLSRFQSVHETESRVGGPRPERCAQRRNGPRRDYLRSHPPRDLRDLRAGWSARQSSAGWGARAPEKDARQSSAGWGARAPENSASQRLEHTSAVRARYACPA